MRLSFGPSLKGFPLKFHFKMAVVSYLSLRYIHSLQKISYFFCPRSVASVWRCGEAVAAGGVESMGESPLLVALARGKEGENMVFKRTEIQAP